MNCRFPEHHRPPGSDSPAALAWVAVLAIITAAAVSPAVHGLITDVLWAAGAIGAVVVVVTVTVLVARRRRRPRRSAPSPVVVVLTEAQMRAAVRSGDFLRAVASPRRDVSALSRGGVPTYVVVRDDDDRGGRDG